MTVELLAIAAAMVVGAFLKGVTGMGLPLIAIPALAPVVGVERAVVIMALPTAVTNAWLAWRYRTHLHETRNLPVLLGSGVLAAVGGAWLLTALDDRILSVVVATLVFAYVALLLLKPQARLREQPARWLAWPVGIMGGALQGATGLSGPVLATYLHATRLPQPTFVLSITLLFGVFAVAQAAGLVALGRYTGDILARSVLATILVMAVLPLGTLAARRLPRRVFDGIVLVVLVVSSIKLVWDVMRV